VVIVQCGRLVDEWGDPNKKITTFSVRKSLISALYGIYSTEGKIDVNETLEQAGIDDSPLPLTKDERQARTKWGDTIPIAANLADQIRARRRTEVEIGIMSP
jgi:hypothetical protein